MSNSTEKMEREVEETRARLDRTLDTLQSRLTVPGLAEDLVGTPAPARAMNANAQRLLDTVKENVLPALLIGAGLGLLLYDALRQEAERRRLRVASSESAPDAHLPENRPARTDERLDDALEESFPGSDPVSVRITR
ncbi:DUF3618 domain-containing protein [Methylobacterium nodulans]|uniref:DUF3618 domain-containing protein n=1 Tax=Methylobacterium nodulans (strain LMG 21967 / CNCM I-2342 / ORS 2060) TaxID=460265 RepID=B8IHU8_METNO|nr:DUF3618 domain-containing protein [Methylobacterium nodulans]ACL55986.1 conserved hypothetical protein [Methylobacterium nodulans ORS 2060]